MRAVYSGRLVLLFTATDLNDAWDRMREIESTIRLLLGAELEGFEELATGEIDPPTAVARFGGSS